MKPFKLQEITQMKLKCIRITQDHLIEAINKDHFHEIAACNKELVILKHEAMHPQEVLDSIQSKLST